MSQRACRNMLCLRGIAEKSLFFAHSSLVGVQVIQIWTLPGFLPYCHGSAARLSLSLAHTALIYRLEGHLFKQTWRFRPFSSLILAILLTGTLIAQTGSRQTSTPPKDDQGKIESVDRSYLDALSQSEQHYAGTINYGDLIKSAIDTMLHGLDPHSNYFDPKEYAQLREKQQARYSGI